MYSYTPEQRAEALREFFGWQGGTIHQLESATGCNGLELLYQDLPQSLGAMDSLASRGFSAIRTCSVEHRRNVLALQYNDGCTLFWAGVIIGYCIDHY